MRKMRLLSLSKRTAQTLKLDKACSHMHGAKLMKIKSVRITVRHKKYDAEVAVYDEGDRKTLRRLFESWKVLKNGLTAFKSRAVNFPEGVSEAAFCLHTGSWRVVEVKGGPGSFDTYNPETHRMEQIKAVSVENDLTSFGPKSIWDDLYWLDFYRNGKLDGSFDIYKIPNKIIYNFKVSAKQTFKDQQKQGRRPRLRVRSEIIKKFNLKSLSSGKI